MYILGWQEGDSIVLVGTFRPDKDYVQHEADMLNENHVGKAKMKAG